VEIEAGGYGQQVYFGKGELRHRVGFLEGAKGLFWRDSRALMV